LDAVYDTLADRALLFACGCVRAQIRASTMPTILAHRRKVSDLVLGALTGVFVTTLQVAAEDAAQPFPEKSRYNLSVQSHPA